MCTALLNKALNQDQVIAVHIDNGFMRKRESQSVEEALTKLGIKLKGTTSAYSHSACPGKSVGAIVLVMRCSNELAYTRRVVEV